MDLLTPRNIYQKTIIWYDWADNQKAHYDSIYAVTGGPFLRVTREEEVLDLIDLSIRTTLIVSDEGGYEFIR